MSHARVRIEGGETGMSTRVLVDGKPLRVSRMVVKFETASYTTAEIDLYPDDVAAVVGAEHVAVTCALCGYHHECGVPRVGPSESPPWLPPEPERGAPPGVACRCVNGVGSHHHAADGSVV